MHPLRFPRLTATPRLTALVASLAFLSIVAAHGQAPTVTYTATGTSGAYTLDFAFTSNLNPAQYPDTYLYFIGVDTGNSDTVTGSPARMPNYAPGWGGNAADGGSNENYNDTWLDSGYSTDYSEGIHAGETLSGFDVFYGGATVPTSIDWFGYQFSPSGNFYSGPGAFHSIFGLAGFEGVADLEGRGVPDNSASVALLGAGLIGLAVMGRALRSRRPAA